MRKRRIIYSVALAIVLLTNFIYSDYMPFMLLWIMILIPIIMFAYGSLMRQNIKVTLNVSEKYSVRGFPVHYKIRVRNSMLLALDDINIELESLYKNYDKPDIKKHIISARSMQEEKIDASYRILYDGNHETYISRISFMDPLKLFTFNAWCNDRYTVEAMPPLIHPDQDMINAELDEYVEANEFSDNRSGDDPSEMFDVRGYHGGDNLNRIHWKLSARNDDLLVKEFSMPVNKSNCIAAELNMCKSDGDRRNLDGIYEMVYAITNLALLKEKAIQVNQIYVNSEESMESMVLEMINSETRSDGLSWSFMASEMEKFNKVIYVTDRLSDEFMEVLCEPHEYSLQCICISDDNSYRENAQFAGGTCIYVNNQQIALGLRLVKI